MFGMDDFRISVKIPIWMRGSAVYPGIYQDSTLKQIMTVFLHISFDNTAHFDSWKPFVSNLFVTIIRLHYRAIKATTLS
jgi:hypothetical protein